MGGVRRNTWRSRCGVQGGDEFEFIPDSDEEDSDQLSYVHDGDDEIVPETEVQEISDKDQIGQREVVVPQRSLGYDS